MSKKEDDKQNILPVKDPLSEDNYYIKLKDETDFQPFYEFLRVFKERLKDKKFRDGIFVLLSKLYNMSLQAGEKELAVIASMMIKLIYEEEGSSKGSALEIWNAVRILLSKGKKQD